MTKSGGFYESDIIAAPMRFPPLLDLIAMMAGRITSRKARLRGNGPHYTVQQSWQAWGFARGYSAFNIVSRVMDGRDTCMPPPGYLVFSVKHEVTWRSSNKQRSAPISWKSSRVVKKLEHLPPKSKKMNVVKEPTSQVFADTGNARFDSLLLVPSTWPQDGAPQEVFVAFRRGGIFFIKDFDLEV